MFEEQIEEIIEELRQKKRDEQGFCSTLEKFYFPYNELNKRLQVKFNIMQEIKNIIYNSANSKYGNFIYNKFTMKTQLNPEVMSTMN